MFVLLCVGLDILGIIGNTFYEACLDNAIQHIVKRHMMVCRWLGLTPNSAYNCDYTALKVHYNALYVCS